MADVSEIRSRLARLRTRVFTAMLLDGGTRVAGALLGVVALSFLLDRFFKLEVAARAVLLVVGLAVLAWIVWRFLLRRMGGVPGEDPLAIAVERRFPELGDRLISAIQLVRETEPERYGMSPQLIDDAVEEALEPARTVRFGDVLAGSRLLRTVALGILAIAILSGGAAADPESARIWFLRNVLLQDVRWPQKTYLEVDPDRFPGRVAKIVRGEDLVVTARSVGEVHPDRVTIHFRDSEGDRGRATMKADVQSHVYRHEFKEIAFPITFHLEGGDEKTRDFRIELLEPPEVAELTVHVAFPDYAGRDPEPVDLSAGDPEMLRGGRIILRGRSTKRLQGVKIVLGESDEDALDAELAGAHEFALTFAPEDTVLVGIRLRDTDGLTNPLMAPRFLVRVLDDRAPKVRLQKLGIGPMVVQGAVLPYRVRIRDDVRAVSGRIEIRRSAGDTTSSEPQVVPLPDDRLGTHDAEVFGEIEIGSLEADPGDFLALTAHAIDNAQPEAHEGKSDPVTVKVVTLEELFSELLRRQQEQRRLFEELILKEKRLRDRYRDLRDSPPSSPAEVRVRMESQAQEQREIARRVHAVERAMTQIFQEMLNNRIYDASHIGELRRKVVRALERLRTVTMSDHARDLDEFARRAGEVSLPGDDGAAIDSGYLRVIQAMEGVLREMVKVPAFTEIVARMRDILKLHKGVKEATRRKYEEVMREIFEEPPGEEESGD